MSEPVDVASARPKLSVQTLALIGGLVILALLSIFVIIVVARSSIPPTLTYVVLSVLISLLIGVFIAGTYWVVQHNRRLLHESRNSWSKRVLQMGATRSALTALGAIAFFAIFLLAALVGVIWFLTTKTNGATAEIVLAPVLLIAVVVLVLALGALSVVFKRLRLENRNAAMGMPDGSIRAVIALMLILLFFILAIFLLGQLRASSGAQTGQIEGLSAAQADAIPAAQLFSKTRSGGTDVAPIYTVVRVLPVDQGVQNYSNQLLTTISTLVVAVASFYFASSSVSSAVRKLGGSTANRISLGDPESLKRTAAEAEATASEANANAERADKVASAATAEAEQANQDEAASVASAKDATDRGDQG